MENYDPEKMELSTRDVVARANYTEVQEGRGSEHGGVYLDITHLGYDGIMKKLPTMYEQFLKLADIDISSEPMEVFDRPLHDGGDQDQPRERRFQRARGSSPPASRRRSARREPPRGQLALRPTRLRS